MEHRPARQVQVDGPSGVARRRDGQERDHQRIGQSARNPDHRIEPSEQQRIGIEIEVEAEHAGERNGERPDAPPQLRQYAAHHVLDQHQPGNRDAQPKQVASARTLQPGQSRQRRALAQQDAGDERNAHGDGGTERQHGTRPYRGGIDGRRRFAQQARQEREPRRISRRIGDVRSEQRSLRPGWHDEQAQQRPRGRRHQRREQESRARAAMPTQQHACSERRIAGERQPKAPCGHGAERIRGHGIRSRSKVGPCWREKVGPRPICGRSGLDAVQSGRDDRRRRRARRVPAPMPARDAAARRA